MKNKNPCERRFFVLCARTFSAERCLFRPATRARINIKGKCVSSSSSSTSNTTFSSSSSTLFSPLPLLPTSSPFRFHPLLSLSLSFLPSSFHPLPLLPCVRRLFFLSVSRGRRAPSRTTGAHNPTMEPRRTSENFHGAGRPEPFGQTFSNGTLRIPRNVC